MTTTADAAAVPLTQPQLDLLSSLGHATPGISFVDGLPPEAVSSHRAGDNSGGAAAQAQALNNVPPPVKCPPWICCLLPCIGHLPSMVLYNQLKPDDAEVRREGEWVCYDAASLVSGDVVRLREGDRVPADCVVLSLGDDVVMAPAATMEEEGEMIVDLSMVRGGPGNDKPVTITGDDVRGWKGSGSNRDDFGGGGGGSAVELLYGGLVLHGCGVAVVTATGKETVLAKLMRTGGWPPSSASVNRCGGGDEDDDAGISLLGQSGSEMAQRSAGDTNGSSNNDVV